MCTYLSTADFIFTHFTDDNHHSSLEESLIVMEFEAKFHLDSQNLPATLKQIESSKITGSKKAEILLRCATLMSKETNMKPQHRKSKA